MNDKITSFHCQDSLMQFLYGLNESYSQVRTQILMMEPSPSIDKAFSLLIQEERQRALGFNGVLQLIQLLFQSRLKGLIKLGRTQKERADLYAITVAKLVISWKSAIN